MKFEDYDQFYDIIPNDVTDMAVTHISEHTNGKIKLTLHIGSYMSAHVLLNLLNKLGKRDKMQGLPSISFSQRV